MRNTYVKFLIKSVELWIFIFLLISVLLIYLPNYDIVRKYNNKAADLVRLETGRYAAGHGAKFHLFSAMDGCRFEEASVRVIYFKNKEIDPSVKNMCIPLE